MADMDEKTLQAAQKGDEKALTVLLAEHQDFISNVVFRFNWNREESRDVVQNIFIKVIKGIKSFKGNCKLTTWLYRIAVNECIEHNRRTARLRDMETDFDRADDAFFLLNADDPFKELKDREIKKQINASLNEMQIDLKTAFCLYYFGGYSGEEAAKAMNITEANFYMKIKKARDQLKQKLMDKGWTRY
jgi:RNA polymerase sigma-70 factor (ECF subfamily)